MHNPGSNEHSDNNYTSNKKNMPSSSVRSELNSAKTQIKDKMKNLGGLNDNEIDKEFKKIDKQLDRRDIYFNAFHHSSKKPEYNNISTKWE